MKRCLLVLLVVCVAGCSWSDEEPAGSKEAAAYVATHLNELWTWQGDAGAAGNVETDHTTCTRTSNQSDHPALVRTKLYLECMVAKGWKRDAEAWAQAKKK